jgi:hypothetical protein
MGKRRAVVEAAASATHKRQAAVAGQQAIDALPKTDRKALRRWYAEGLQPRLSRMSPAEIVRGTAVRRSYAYYIVAGYIVAGTRIPHPRHYPNLAALVGVELPMTLAAAHSFSR